MCVCGEGGIFSLPTPYLRLFWSRFVVLLRDIYHKKDFTVVTKGQLRESSVGDRIASETSFRVEIWFLNNPISLMFWGQMLKQLKCFWIDAPRVKSGIWFYLSSPFFFVWFKLFWVRTF